MSVPCIYPFPRYGAVVVPHNGCTYGNSPLPPVVWNPPSPPPEKEPEPTTFTPPSGGPGRRPQPGPDSSVPQGGDTPQPGGPDSSAPIPNPRPRRVRFVGGPDRSSWVRRAAPARANPSEVVWSYRGALAEGYPWPNATLNSQNYPTPGMFFDANNTLGAFRFSGVESFIIAAVGSALSMAGVDASLATARTAAGRRLRKQMLDLIQCSKFNDGLYGAVSAPKVSPNGRGVVWAPVHNDVFSMLSEGKTPARAIDVEGNRLPQFIEASSRPLVWIPAVNLDILATRNEISVERMAWEDGVSTLEPPPLVRSMKISLSDVRLPGGVGCSSMFIPNPGHRRAYTQARSYWERKGKKPKPKGGSSTPIIFTMPTK